MILTDCVCRRIEHVGKCLGSPVVADSVTTTEESTKTAVTVHNGKGKRKVLVLGGGLVGGVLAGDLSEDPTIACTVADASVERLDTLRKAYPNLSTLQLNLGDKAVITQHAKGFDMAVGALPSWLGFNALQAVLDANKNYVDISFMKEDFTSLNSVAKAKGLVAICDCGVAPGMSNMMCARGSMMYERGMCDNCVIYVGGLPQKPRYPFNYKAPFSPRDVLAEYTRMSTVVVDGKVKEVPALADLETIQLPLVPGGKPLEAFITDGLRSLAKTIPAKNMCEKTLRWPGHQMVMQTLRDAGFLGEKPFPVSKTTSVVPIELSSQLLFKQWKQDLENDPEFTVMRVQLDGKLRWAPERRRRVVFDLYDETDTTVTPRRASMARCTAYTCAIVARMVLNGQGGIPFGVHPPEIVGFNAKLFEEYREQLGLRGVKFTQEVIDYDAC